jgi:hypothetical protein
MSGKKASNDPGLCLVKGQTRCWAEPIAHSGRFDEVRNLVSLLGIETYFVIFAVLGRYS